MTLPSPNDMANAPVWENYVVAQAVQACLGQQPTSALAIGVRIDGIAVELRFYLTAVTPNDVEDMSDAVSELEGLLGNHVRVQLYHEVVAWVDFRHNDVRFIYSVRSDSHEPIGSYQVCESGDGSGAR